VGLSDEATALRIETEDIITELRIRRPELIAASDTDRYEEALHYASVARQLLDYHAELARESSDRLSRLLGIRDAMMADNLAYMVSRERERGKVFVFAHNSHLKRGKMEWQLGPQVSAWWPAGSHLDEILGPRYAVIGTGVGVSEANGIGKPEPGTLEAILTAAPGKALFIPTHKGKGLPAAAIAALPTRTGSKKNPTYFALTPQSFTDFDWLAVLDSVGYNRGGPVLPEPEAGTGPGKSQTPNPKSQNEQ
jgi:erythromycin esterase-like protein